MQNWYCLVHFPDGTDGIHLIPGPAPVGHRPTVKTIGHPGTWLVKDITRDAHTQDYAAEIWVEQHELEPDEGSLDPGQ